jgi:hypothetical protein
MIALFNLKMYLLSVLFFAGLQSGEPAASQKLTENQILIALGRVYGEYMFDKVPSTDVLNSLKELKADGFEIAADFVSQTVSANNNMLSERYLTRPNNKILKQIYIIRRISQSVCENQSCDFEGLADSLSRKEVSAYELTDNYYGMLFTAVGNKNRPFDLSSVNFKMSGYKLKDNTEKGIFFLRCMDVCGKTVWGYMNIPKHADTKSAYDNIKKFPKFNGRPYYQFLNLFFPDFKLIIVQNTRGQSDNGGKSANGEQFAKGEQSANGEQSYNGEQSGNGAQSYKGHYLFNYYETLIAHLLCLYKEGATKEEIHIDAV